jgi:Holliday junction resolvasome RuvABC endonuclease subunit
MSIIIGFDLGSREAGCVVWEEGEDFYTYRFRARSCGWSSRKQFWAWADYLVRLYSEDVAVEGRDCVVAAESAFYGKYVSAAIGLARLIGMVEGMAHKYETRFVEVRASEAKLALAGMGNASKEEMMAAAEAQFPGHEWDEHTADALGVSLAAAGKLRLEAMAAAAAQPELATGAPAVL